MSTENDWNMEHRLLHLAHENPETRAVLVPLLRKHASGGDEMEAAREFVPLDGGKNKDYGGAKNPGGWSPKNKGPGKCFYLTGDPADRCYVTTKGGPGGKTKPNSGPAGGNGSKQRAEYNKKYIKQRWK